MRNFIKKTLYFLFILFLFLCMIFSPKISLHFSSQGLLIWFQTMIPTLLPFMILSSLAVKTQLHRIIVRVFAPFFSAIYQINTDSIYCIVFGSICGFPMGAKIAADLLENHYISRKECAYLLLFTNNIGPIYFINIVLQGVSPEHAVTALSGMYLIPLLYGFFLRYTLFHSMKITNVEHSISRQSDCSFFYSLDDSITSSLTNITRLGGYMIFFNLCVCIPYHIINIVPLPRLYLMRLNCLFEISSGIQNVLNSTLSISEKEFLILPFVMFGGFSCLAQTMSMIRKTNISIIPYLWHKGVQTLLYFVFLSLLN